MGTALIVVAGLALLGVFALVGWRNAGGAGSLAVAAKIFIPVWLGTIWSKARPGPRPPRGSGWLP